MPETKCPEVLLSAPGRIPDPLQIGVAGQVSPPGLTESRHSVRRVSALRAAPGVRSPMDIRFDIRTWSARDESVLRRAMCEDRELRAKLARLEAQFRRAGSPGGKSLAGAAIERLQGRLAGSGEKREQEVEVQHSLPDAWSADLFCAVRRKHGVRPCRYRRQRQATVVVRARESEFDRGAWQECYQLHAELADCFNDVTGHLFLRGMGSGGSGSARPGTKGGVGRWRTA